MIGRAKQRGLPFEGVSCDELYGRSAAFRRELTAEGICYAAYVPCDYRVYLQRPEVGVPPRPNGQKGKHGQRLRVLNEVHTVMVKDIVSDARTHWHPLRLRTTERGYLEAEFAARRVWTWQAGMPAVCQEWLVIRREASGRCTYALCNAPADTSLVALAELTCSRYFVERTLEDAKDECGWDDFQAQKYLAWQHHTALTACALWFIAQQKLAWAAACARDPDLLQQLALEVLPALSTANVRALLTAALPLPELTVDEAHRQVARHLLNRSRARASRLKRNHALVPSAGM